MDYNNLWMYSLSELSFEYLTRLCDSDERDRIKKEILIRFLNNGCDFYTFISNENKVIEKRGDNIDNYLIKSNPTGEDLFFLYLNYVYKTNYERDNLLLSEIMLCNNTSRYSFFTKCIKLELKNLKNRIEKNPKDEDLKRLKDIYAVLYNRYNEEWFSPRYNSLVYAFDGIIPSNNILYSKKVEKAIDDYIKNFSDGYYKYVLLSNYLQSEILKDIKTRNIIKSEMIRLSSQKESIVKSLKKDKNINYRKLVLK